MKGKYKAGEIVTVKPYTMSPMSYLYITYEDTYYYKWYNMSNPDMEYKTSKVVAHKNWKPCEEAKINLR